MNEEAVGKGIAKSSVPRDELFITTQIWVWVEDTLYEKTIASVERSLDRLNLD